MHVREPGEESFLPDERRRRLLRRRPRFLIAAALHVPVDLDSPLLRTRRRIPHAAEGNADLDFVPPIGHVAARFPDEISAQVGLARHHVRPGNEPAALALRAVGLHAKRVHGEDQRVIAFVERIEMDLHVVVGANPVAVGQGGAHGSVRFVGTNTEEDRVRRIPHEHIGRIGRRPSVNGHVEREASQHRGALPHQLIQFAIHRNVSLDARNGDNGLMLAAVKDTLCRRGHRGRELKAGEDRQKHCARRRKQRGVGGVRVRNGKI